jgi:hypothetical protein
VPFVKQQVPFSGGSAATTSTPSSEVNLFILFFSPVSDVCFSPQNYFLVVTSPYFESVSMLQGLSREGEMQVAQKIMDRLTELNYKLCDFTANHSAVSLMTNTGAGGLSGESESKRLVGGSSSRLDAAGANTPKKNKRRLLKLEQSVHVRSLIYFTFG